VTATVQAPTTYRYVPQHRQSIYATCPADRTAFGGAAGGGKTHSTIHNAISTCRTYPGYNRLILRRITREYEQMLERCRTIMAAHPGLAHWEAKQRWWRFKNGSLLGFGHAANELDIEKYAGDEWSEVDLEEAGEFTPYQRQFIPSRIRSPQGYLPRINETMNPIGVSFMDIKNEYVTPPDRNVELIAWFDEPAALAALALDPEAIYDYARYWKWYEEGTRGNPAELIGMDDDGVVNGIILVWRPDPNDMLNRVNAERARDNLPPVNMPSRCFIQSKLRDNKYYYEDGHYAASLAANVGTTLAERLLMGSWKFFEGQAFPEWNPSIHVVDPISIPEAWSTRIWGGMDWGWAKPGAHYWAVQEPTTNQIIIYRELYEDHWNDSLWTDSIKQMTLHPERLRFSLADPSMWRGTSDDQGLSTAEIYRRSGVILEPGNNDRLAGWRRIRQLLATDPITGKPGLVVTRNCVNLIREFPAATLDKNRPEDIDSDGSDHGLDALRYAVMARTTHARRYTKRSKTGRVIR
jgi:hypothetical protein